MSGVPGPQRPLSPVRDPRGVSRSLEDIVVVADGQGRVCSGSAGAPGGLPRRKERWRCSIKTWQGEGRSLHQLPRPPYPPPPPASLGAAVPIEARVGTGSLREPGGDVVRRIRMRRRIRRRKWRTKAGWGVEGRACSGSASGLLRRSLPDVHHSQNQEAAMAAGGKSLRVVSAERKPGVSPEKEHGNYPMLWGEATGYSKPEPACSAKSRHRGTGERVAGINRT
jgi:hypothetical protein